MLRRRPAARGWGTFIRIQRVRSAGRGRQTTRAVPGSRPGRGAGAERGAQALHLGAEQPDLRAQALVLGLELQDAWMPARLTPSAGEPRDLAQPRDVAQRVEPVAAAGAVGRDEPEPVVLPQRLRVQPGDLRGDRDGVDRACASSGRSRSSLIAHRSAFLARAEQVGARVVVGRRVARTPAAPPWRPVESRCGTATSTVTSRSPLVPSLRRHALAAHAQHAAVLRALRPGGPSPVPPLGVGTSMSAPSAASANVTGTVTVRLSPSRPNTGCGVTVHGDEQVAGLAAVLAGRALAAQPDPLAVLDAGRDAGLDRAGRRCVAAAVAGRGTGRRRRARGRGRRGTARGRRSRPRCG